MNPVSIREMLECGVHFGHPVKRWNPKMKKFIFGDRNGISIIDLQKSARAAKKALQFVFENAANGGKVLFVGTKRQAMDVVQQESDRCECFYVNQRWLGGLLTNFITIQQSIRRLRTLEEMLGDVEATRELKKKEIARLEKERGKLDKVLHGIKDMKKLPSVIFIVDVMKERIAILEARKLGIPIIAVVDTNCDPDGIDFVIPANDDAIRSIGYFASRVADSVIEGDTIFKAKKAEEEAKKAEERAKQEKQRNEERLRREKEKKDRAAKAKQAEGAEAAAAEGEAAAPAEAKGEHKPARARKKESAAPQATAESAETVAPVAEAAADAETKTSDEQ